MPEIEHEAMRAGSLDVALAAQVDEGAGERLAGFVLIALVDCGERDEYRVLSSIGDFELAGQIVAGAHASMWPDSD